MFHRAILLGSTILLVTALLRRSDPDIQPRRQFSGHDSKTAERTFVEQSDILVHEPPESEEQAASDEWATECNVLVGIAISGCGSGALPYELRLDGRVGIELVPASDFPSTDLSLVARASVELELKSPSVFVIQREGTKYFFQRWSDAVQHSRPGETIHAFGNAEELITVTEWRLFLDRQGLHPDVQVCIRSEWSLAEVYGGAGELPCDERDPDRY